MGTLKDRIGECFITNEGYEIIIIKYNNAHDLLIQFQDEHKTIIPNNYSNCVRGKIKNPYHPSVFGVGYIGIGKYKPTVNNKKTKQYTDWYNMLIRCCDKEFKKEHPTYKDAYVYKEWYNFQNFAKWYDNNYYEIDGEVMCLDKDILIKGNKIYSPDTCIFIPERINKLFTKRDALRNNLPIGVSYHKVKNKYQAQCQIIDDENKKYKKYLGLYDTLEEAFLAYKEFKEAHIKEVADEYKDKIPQRLYDAMYNWVVEIDD